MKRVSIPLLGIVILGTLAVERSQKPYFPKVAGRQIAFYKSVVDDWSNVPKLCSDDFPLTEFQKTECDSYWKSVLSRAILASIPFLIGLAIFMLWRRTIQRTYRRAASRVSKRKVAAIGQVVASAPQDFFSWLHGFQAVRIKTGEKELIAYIENEAQTGSKVHLYEAGRWFRQEQLVGVKLP